MNRTLSSVALIVVISIVTILCNGSASYAQSVILPPPSTYGSVSPWELGYSWPQATINVRIDNAFDDRWDTQSPTWPWIFDIPLEEYVLGVVMAELGPSTFRLAGTGWGYHAPDGAWADEAIKAQSIAVRTYGTYRAKEVLTGYSEPGHERGIRSSETTQVYRPNYHLFPEATKSKYRDLISTYRGQYLAYRANDPTQRYKYSLIDSLYAADNTKPNTISWWAPYAYGYLPTVGNPFGASGTVQDRGLPQLGAHGMATAGISAGTRVTTFWQILSHFYPGTQLLNSQPMWVVNTYSGRTNTGCSGTQLDLTSTVWVNYDWDVTSLGILNNAKNPSSSIPSDNVCMHFTTTDTFASDWYTFFIVADDGFKLLIDGAEVLSKWQIQSPMMYSVNVPMTAGSHQIMLKYFEASGGAVARLFYRRWNGMVGSYYNRVIGETEVPGTNGLVWLRADPTIGFHWKNLSPLDTNAEIATYPRIPVDRFSVVWNSHLYIPPGNNRAVTFDLMHDDGMILEIDTGGGFVRFHNVWGGLGSRVFSIGFYPGIYPIRIRYREDYYDAIARVIWK